MMNQHILDLFLTSLAGGALGGAGIVIVLSNYWRRAFGEFMHTKSSMLNAVDIKRMQNDLEVLRMQVIALQVQNGFIEED